MEWIKEKWKGMLLCFVIASVAWLAVAVFHELKLIGAPVIGILIGMIVALFLKDRVKFNAGIAFTSKKYCSMPSFCWGLALILRPSARWGCNRCRSL